MERRFHVIFTGKLNTGFKHVDTVAKMVSLLQIDSHKVTKILYSGRPSIVKQGVSGEQAKKYRDQLERVGLQIKIMEAEPEPAVPPPSPSPLVKPPPEAGEDEIENAAPLVPAEKISARQPPPEAPPAPIDDEDQPERVLEAVRVANSHGWFWIKEAFSLFFGQQLRWLTMMLLWLGIFILPVALSPVYGGLVDAAVFPVFLGGMMFGANRQHDRDQLRLGHLFNGFGRKFPQFLGIGCFSLLTVAAQVVAMKLYTGQTFTLALHPPASETINTLSQTPSLFFGGLFLVLILSLPLFMCFYFAPCLAGIDDQTAFASLLLSFKAIRTNIVAFSIYGLACLLLGFVFIFLWGALNTLFLILFGSDHILSLLLPILCMVLLGIPLATIVLLSVYTGYRDIFHGIPENQREAPSPPAC
ncbi:MAG: BPSS1780 family membrane protein [Desulfocapsaceae bacterium]|nr:BPSS1780 family membrane protein [Desulfocapsaceae bacterium]